MRITAHPPAKASYFPFQQHNIIIIEILIADFKKDWIKSKRILFVAK